jgi:hypothetical protein
MNTQLLRAVRYLVGATLTFLGVAFLIFGLPGSRAQQSQGTDQDRCYEWQYRDENGNCVDKQHVHHHYHTHYEPEGGEQCWIECMCEEGTSPSGDDCGACSFVGTVCMDL